jgi:microcystin-dependent protein
MTILASTLTTATEKGHSLMAGMGFAPNGNLTARGGVIAGLALTKTSGMGFQLGTGRAGVQYTTLADGGVIPFTVTAAETGSFTAGDSVKDRIDLVYAYIDSGTVKIGVAAGALPSSGSPVAPATPADAEPLYRVLIAAGTSVGSGGWSTANITDVRRWPAFGQDVGDVKYSARTTAPDGWLIAAGQTVSRTIYADLFAAIGTAFGTGDGSTTFTLPDLRERMPAGVKSGSTEFGTVGQTGGAKTHAHTLSDAGQAQITVGAATPSTLIRRVTTVSWSPSINAGTAGAAGGTAQTTGAALTGSTDAGAGLPPYVTLTPLIKI